jgi:hypothetical protein
VKIFYLIIFVFFSLNLLFSEEYNSLNNCDSFSKFYYSEKEEEDILLCEDFFKEEKKIFNECKQNENYKKIDIYEFKVDKKGIEYNDSLFLLSVFYDNKLFFDFFNKKN